MTHQTYYIEESIKLFLQDVCDDTIWNFHGIVVKEKMVFEILVKLSLSNRIH